MNPHKILTFSTKHSLKSSKTSSISQIYTIKLLIKTPNIFKKMGKVASKGHEEYNRDSIKCRGYVEKYSFKRGVSKRFFFTLKDTSLSYSKDKDQPVISK